jgi:hypothetical protein
MGAAEDPGDRAARFVPGRWDDPAFRGTVAEALAVLLRGGQQGPEQIEHGWAPVHRNRRAGPDEGSPGPTTIGRAVPTRDG